MRLHFLLFLILLSGTVFSQIQSEDRTSKGTDFWIGFMPNAAEWRRNIGQYTHTQIYITTDDGADVVVSIPQQGFSFDEAGNPYTTDNVISIPPNSTIAIDIPYEYTITNPTGGQTGADYASEVDDDPRGVHVQSLNNSISVYAMNTNSQSADATLVYPTTTLGTQYYAITNNFINNLTYATSACEMIVVATEDNTTVDITLSTETVGGVNAGETISVVLDAGEVYQIQSVGDLSGTYVHSRDCKPVAVYSGNTYTGVPDPYSTRDVLFEQMQPLQNWGRRFISAPYLTRVRSDIYKVVAAYDNTELSVFNSDGETTYDLDAGDVLELNLDYVPDHGYYFEASKPISLAHFSASSGWDGVDNADPFLDLLPSMEQSIDRIVFTAFEGTNVNTFYLNVFARTSVVPTVTLDGVSISDQFQDNVLYGTSAFQFARIPITGGEHILESDGGVQANVYGYEQFESYGYIAGANASPITLDFDISYQDEQENYSVYQDTACVMDTIIFYALDLPDVSSYTWVFPQTGREVVGDTAWVISNTEQQIEFMLIGTKDYECRSETDTLFKSIFIQAYPDPQLEVVDSICAYGDDLNPVYSPAGGTLYIDGIPDMNIQTDEYSVGDHYLSYELSSSAGCASVAYDTTRFLELVEPIVEIATDTNNVCEGTPVTLSLINTEGGGNNPYYEWYVNDSYVGDGLTYTSIEFENEDEVKVILYSDAHCRVRDTAVDELTIYIELPVIPSITLIADQSQICYGTPVNYTIQNTEHEGDNPYYEWLLNGDAILGQSANAHTFTSSDMENGDIVQIILHSSEECITTDTVSDRVPILVMPVVVPSVTIDALYGPLCEGLSNTFSVIDSTGGGTDPSFRWFLNGTELTETTPVVTIDNLSNDDVVDLEMTSNADCANPRTATDDLVVQMIPLVTPELDIDGIQRICETENIFIEVIETVNGGDNPDFLWYLNQVITNNIGTQFHQQLRTAVHTIETVMYSDLLCVTTDTASDDIEVTVVQLIEPQIELNVVDDNLCELTDIRVFIADTGGAGEHPSFDWYIDNELVASNTYSIRTDTLHGGRYIKAQMTTDVECSLVPYVRDSVQVVFSPEPEIISDRHLCLDETINRVEYRNNAGTGGRGVLLPMPGLSERADYHVFDPDDARLGDHILELEWTDTNNCRATTFDTITVHQMDPPIPVDIYDEPTNTFQDVIGFPPYDVMYARGVGLINWFDADTNVIVENTPLFEPDHDCDQQECLTTYYINQVDPIYGCVSEYVPVYYTLTNCEVPPPVTNSVSICNYWNIPDLYADTASLWINGSPRGESILVWYRNIGDNYNSDIARDVFSIDPAQFVDDDNVTIFVRQYSPGWNCYGPPASISLGIHTTPPPYISREPQVCDGEPIPTLQAVGQNIRWYIQDDTTSTLLGRGNSFQPSSNQVPVGDIVRFYATQTYADSCQSEPVEGRIRIFPVPLAPIPQIKENCEHIPAVFETPDIDEQGVVWMNALGSILEDSDDYDTTLVLRKRWMRYEDTTYFGAYAYNELGCTSDTIPFKYRMITIPPTPERIDDNYLVCLAKGDTVVLEAHTYFDRLEWYGAVSGFILDDSASIFVPNIDSVGNYNYYLFAYNEHCRSFDSLYVPVIVGDKPTATIYGERLHCAYTYHHSFVDTSYNPNTRFEWHVTGGRVASTADESGSIFYVDWDEPGIDTISMVEINDFGCTDTSELIVAISDYPVADFEPTNLETTMSVFFENMSTQTDVIEHGELYDSVIPVTLTSYWNYGRETDVFDNIHSWNQFRRVDTVNYPYGYWDVELVVVNSFGCRDSIKKTIFVDVEHALYIPNIFQPGHFAFGVSHYSPQGFNLKTYEISIFDIWGNLLWYSNKLTKLGIPAEEWDGTYEGVPLKSDTYIWQIEATFRNNTEWKGIERNGKYYKYGSVVLLR